MSDTIIFPQPSDDEVTDGHPPHYTDLPTSLELQSDSAIPYVREFWSQAKQTASRVIGSSHREIILCGCGDSHHAAYSISHALESWTARPSRGIHALEAARYTIPRISSKDLLVIGISASGETARTIEAVDLARQLGARTLALTCNPASMLSTKSHGTFAIELPDLPEGPGLISYLGALLAGYALAAELTQIEVRNEIDGVIGEIPDALQAWATAEAEKGREAARRIDPLQPMLFLGAGPVRGAAMFAAAKAIEAVGQPASSQDVEEWAHLEYFSEPAASPIWLLTAGGRSSIREGEVAEAARRIGRSLISSDWEYGPDSLREEISPLALWVGPVAYADALMKRIGQEPFRGFRGGRRPEEGGGVSRIRSSDQIRSLKEFDRFNPLS